MTSHTTQSTPAIPTLRSLVPIVEIGHRLVGGDSSCGTWGAGGRAMGGSSCFACHSCETIDHASSRGQSIVPTGSFYCRRLIVPYSCSYSAYITPRLLRRPTHHPPTKVPVSSVCRVLQTWAGFYHVHHSSSRREHFPKNLRRGEEALPDSELSCSVYASLW